MISFRSDLAFEMLEASNPEAVTLEAGCGSVSFGRFLSCTVAIEGDAGVMGGVRAVVGVKVVESIPEAESGASAGL